MFTCPISDGDSITRGRITLTVRIEHDDTCREPWSECDGHGTVSDWTTRAKLPGELILASDGGSHRYYDYASAVRMARAEGWGSLWPYTLRMERTRNGSHVATAVRYGAPALASKPRRDISAALNELYDMRRAMFPSARAYHANAAMADYDYLRHWCDDQWSYVGVIVTATDTRTGIELASASLWGIGSDDTDGLTMRANDLIDECVTDANATRAALTE